MSEVLLETRNLKKYFPHKLGYVHAVDDVTLKINIGETLGVVGESGCGKSTLGRTILRLLEPTEGEVIYEGRNILPLKGKEFRKIQTGMQMVFQDPYSSLNPRMSVYDLIAEPLKVCKTVTGKEAMAKKVQETMELCGLSERHNNVYPHEMDGGRRQRVGLARALVLDPKFVVCDEPVSALDVSIQAQILNLLMDMQESRNLAYMFITHDLCVVRHISSNIMVMYMGQVVEYATKDEIFAHHVHPYTKALMSAIPTADLSRRNRERHVLKGEVSNPINPAPGCRFTPRCPYAGKKCQEPQPLTQIAPDHFVACHECVSFSS
ncbi:MAG: ATP-binding cassette domain-containing protein [Hungatella sp.]|nr:ATP-binding cassette domain-containing protein [Hungatella sp.]